MSLLNNVYLAYHEGAVELAINAFQSDQCQCQKAAAIAFNVCPTILNRYVRGVTCKEIDPNGHTNDGMQMTDQ
jgi:hypothetical protein